LRFQDPNNVRNSVRLTEKVGHIFARLIKGTNHYDEAGNMLPGKEGIGIPIERFRVPDNFYPQ